MISDSSSYVVLPFCIPDLVPRAESARWLREILPITLHKCYLTNFCILNSTFTPALLAQCEVSLSEAGRGRSRGGDREKEPERGERLTPARSVSC